MGNLELIPHFSGVNIKKNMGEFNIRSREEQRSMLYGRCLGEGRLPRPTNLIAYG